MRRFILPAAIAAGLLCLAADPFAVQREQMVRTQIEARGVRQADILRVMRATPRHLFVPAPLRAYAYDDTALPIGYGATISQPFVVARMTELLELEKTQRVLEIGTGSGYQAAVLAQLAAQVYTIEIVPELSKAAGDRLKDMGYRNVTVRHGDGYRGWPEKAPFDRILLTASPPEVPQALLDQLARPGKLVAPVGTGSSQDLVVIEKSPSGDIHRRLAGSVLFVPMVRGKDTRH